MSRLRVLTVIGTRPEIIRLSRTIPLLDASTDHTLVHTGQNFTDSLSRVFFEDLGVRDPDVWLNVDTSSFGRQLGTLFESFERTLDERRPDRVVILGDTNSALVAFNCKRRGIPVYHLEAGNRCYDDRVPEEVNRRVIDHCSAVLLPYTERSAQNLVREGIERHRIFVIGNPIYDVLEHYASQIGASRALDTQRLVPGAYLLATTHRAENVDDPAVLECITTALGRVADLYQMPLLLSVHPRVEPRLPAGVFAGSRVVTLPAMRFFDFVKLQQHAALVLTDSGTVQEECAIFGVPVLTIRNSTERPETIEAGSNLVTSTDPERILDAARFLQSQPARGGWTPPREYVERGVAAKVVRIVLSHPEWAAGRPGPIAAEVNAPT
jgi:UDP-N-acetylglucosamine 2-epimerase (non-hydrolysing)